MKRLALGLVLLAALAVLGVGAVCADHNDATTQGETALLTPGTPEPL
jgi:hypothetical protein